MYILHIAILFGTTAAVPHLRRPRSGAFRHLSLLRLRALEGDGLGQLTLG